MVIALLSAVGGLPVWSVFSLVVLGGASLSFAVIGLGWAKVRHPNFKSVCIFCSIWVVMGILGFTSRQHTQPNEKKTFINITNSTPPVFYAKAPPIYANDGPPPDMPVLLLNIQYRNAGSFPANRFAFLGRLYLMDRRSDDSEQKVLSDFKEYADGLQYPKQSVTLGPGEHTSNTLIYYFNGFNAPVQPNGIEDVFATQVLYAVSLAGYYDDNGYYHESHFCSSIAWNKIVGFSQRSCKLYGDQH